MRAQFPCLTATLDPFVELIVCESVDQHPHNGYQAPSHPRQDVRGYGYAKADGQSEDHNKGKHRHKNLTAGAFRRVSEQAPNRYVEGQA